MKRCSWRRPGAGHGGAPEGDPGQKPSQNGPDAGQEKGEFVAADGNGHPADGEGKCVAAGGAGDEEPHGHSPVAGGVLVGNDHDPGGVSTSQGDPHDGVQDQGGGEAPGEAGKDQAKNPGGQKGPEVQSLRADPVRHTGEDHQGDGIADLEPAGDDTRLGGRHPPLPLQHRNRRSVAHEHQAVEHPRGADPGQPPVKSCPLHFFIRCVTACSNPSMVSSNMGKIRRMAAMLRV